MVPGLGLEHTRPIKVKEFTPSNVKKKLPKYFNNENPYDINQDKIKSVYMIFVF